MKKIFSLLLALIACAGTMFADGTIGNSVTSIGEWAFSWCSGQQLK